MSRRDLPGHTHDSASTALRLAYARANDRYVDQVTRRNFTRATRAAEAACAFSEMRAEALAREDEARLEAERAT